MSDKERVLEFLPDAVVLLRGGDTALYYIGSCFDDDIYGSGFTIDEAWKSALEALGGMEDGE
jgi:hypothetical protein